MNIEKENFKTVGTIESIAEELRCLLDIAQKFTDGKSDNKDLKEIDFCLTKMDEHVNKLNKLFYEGKIEQLFNPR